MTRPLGVGILGAGPVTQAIHLPTLASLSDRFRVVHVMDVDASVAASVAARTGARFTSSVEALLDDAGVDVVAICSPHQFHAQQVEAAAKAGKRGILCEKPLATTVEQAQLIADVTAASGIPLVVGTMHSWDPAFRAAAQAWGDLPDTTSLVRVTAYLPDNDSLVALSTDPVGSARYSPPRQPVANRRTEAAMVRSGILGLATHNLPMVRQFAPGVDAVLSAQHLDPFGYELAFRCGSTVVQLHALMPGRWRPEWGVHVFGAGAELHIAFPPSYVLAGSATATLATARVRGVLALRPERVPVRVAAPRGCRPGARRARGPGPAGRRRPPLRALPRGWCRRPRGGRPLTEARVYSVLLGGRESRSAVLQRSVLASVPHRFLEVGQPPADVLVVSGDDGDWPDVVEAAVDGGARGVAVVDPGFVDPDRVRRLVGSVEGRAVVAVQPAFIDDPGWRSVQGRLREATAAASLLDSLATVPATAAHDELARALVGQLAIVRPLLESGRRLRLLHRGELTYLLTADTSHPRVTLGGVSSAVGCHGLTLDVVDPDSRWELRFDATTLASPTTISHHTASGTRAEPLIYESGRRTSWQRLHQALTGEGAVGYTLGDLATDLTLARDALQ